MTRRTPGHERTLTEDPQFTALSAAVVAALAGPPGDVFAPPVPTPPRRAALQSVTAQRDQPPVAISDTPGANDSVTNLSKPSETDTDPNLALAVAAPAEWPAELPAGVQPGRSEGRPVERPPVRSVGSAVGPVVERSVGSVAAPVVERPIASAVELPVGWAVEPHIEPPAQPHLDPSAELSAELFAARHAGPTVASAVDTLAALWLDRGGPRDRTVRDLLVAHYGPLVRAVAARMAVGLPASVEVSDLVQAGVFGLLDAIARFDPTRGIRFETYAAQRIRGAMLDELRAQDWVPRTVRSRIREIERTREQLERRLGRAPDRREIAAELGLPLRELVRAGQHRRLVSVEALAESASSVAESVVDESAPDPAEVFALQETHRELAAAVRLLDERDRLVVQLYYVENRTLAEIGRLLGVTESRVCQLHARMVVRLRGRLEERAAG